MQITFYTTSDPPEKLEKELSIIGTATALKPTARVDMLNPVIVCNANAARLAANYVYIDTFDRYYWCTVSLDTANRMILSCKVDYLMSWKNSIRNCPAMILRNENIGINYVIDKKLPVDPNRFSIHGLPFPIDGFNQASQGTGADYKPYLLILNG